MSAEHIHAHGLLQNIHETTPGGIRREQFLPARHPVKTVLACFPFFAFLALIIFAVVSRHHP